MRTRELRLTNFGIGGKETEQLRKEARKKENAGLVMIATREANPGLQESLYISLTKGGGYGSVAKEVPIPIAKEDDWYGWRRVSLVLFKMLLKLQEAETEARKCEQSGQSVDGKEGE